MIEYFPEKIKEKLIGRLTNDVEEIRIRAQKPIILKKRGIEQIIDYKADMQEIEEILQKMCENSIYSYQNQICSGYITLPKGHRVGITGNVVMKNNQIININYISSLNIRISKQILDCSMQLLPYVIDIKNNLIFNTIIVSPPGHGKTTILRDLVRVISDGIDEIGFLGVTVGVVDERGEIASCFHGIPQNNIGVRTDVLDNVSKSIGMRMIVRSMAPKVIVADEIGTKEDAMAIHYAVCSGVKGIFTAHGNNIEDIKKNPNLKELLDENIIERIVFLENKKIKQVYNIKDEILVLK